MQRIWLCPRRGRALEPAPAAALRRPRGLRAGARGADRRPRLRRPRRSRLRRGRRRASTTAAYEREIAELLSVYEALRDGLGFTDEHGRGRPGHGGAPRRPRRHGASAPSCCSASTTSPVARSSLSRRSAGAAEVTVAITFGADRLALAARAELRATLVEELGAEIEPELLPRLPTPRRRSAISSATSSSPAPRPQPPIRRSACSRGRASAARPSSIGRRIAALLADGVDPDAIAVAVRSPDRQAPLLARVLSGLGVPVAAEARVDLAATSTGAAVLGLLAIAGGEGTRGRGGRLPPRARACPSLQRRLARAASAARAAARRPREALEIWRDDERDRRHLGARRARRSRPGVPRDPRAHRRRHRRAAPPPLGSRAVQRPVDRAARRRGDIAGRSRRRRRSANTPPPAPRSASCSLTSGCRSGAARPRVASASSAPTGCGRRGSDHLFVAGLTDGAFPARGRRRSAARRRPARRARASPHGATPRPRSATSSTPASPAPRRRLYLSYPASDEAGIAADRGARSSTRSARCSRRRRRPSGPTTRSRLRSRPARRPTTSSRAPTEASTPRELARALAVGRRRPRGAGGPRRGPRRGRRGARPWPSPRRGRGGRRAGPAERPRRARRARRATAPTAPRPSRSSTPARTAGSSTMSSPRARSAPTPSRSRTAASCTRCWSGCSAEPPTGAGRPEEATVETWRDAAAELIREVAAERGWDLDAAGPRIRMARFEAVIDRFLRRDARETGGPLRPDPRAARGVLRRARGRSVRRRRPRRLPPAREDRPDRRRAGRPGPDPRLQAVEEGDGGGQAGRGGEAPASALHARRRGFGIDPIGGLYSPLGATPTTGRAG